jgi:pyruvate,water dikinase
MRPGDVLVAAGTDFDLALNLTLAGAVVTEEDGILSHAAVVARERGIPCVIGVTGATSRLQTGTVVTVNGDSGTVEATGGGTQR